MGHTHDSHFTVTNVIYLCLKVKFTFKALSGLIIEDLQIARIHQCENCSQQEHFAMQEKLISTEDGIFLSTGP